MTLRLTTLAALALMVGCDADLAATSADATALPVAQAALPQTLTLSLTDPLVPGSPVDVDISGAEPSETVFFIRSNGVAGTGGCPPVLGGECLDITAGGSGYVLTLTLTADGSGNASFSGTLPPTVPPGSLAFQAVSRDASGAWIGSNPLERDVVVCPEDGFEPNDSLPGVAGPASPFSAAVCPGDDDFFAFLVPDGERFDATVTFDDAGDGDMDVDLYAQSTLSIVDDSAGVTDVEEVGYLNMTGGPEGVSLNPFIFSDLGDPGIPYTVDYTIAAPPVCVDDADEDNDDLASAIAFTPGTTGTYALCDDDWFVFPALAGDELTLGFDYDLGEGDIDAELYDSAGTLIELYDFSFTAPESWTENLPADGDYYIRMFQDSDAGATPGNPSYDLSIDLFTPAPCVDDGFEDDDDLASAFAATDGVTETRSLCDEDWFSFDGTAGGEIDVAYDYDGAEGDMDIEVYDSTGTLVTTFTTSSVPTTSTFSVPADDTYFFRMYVDTDGGPSVGIPSYDVTFTENVPSACVDDGNEEDDVQADAMPFTAGTTGTYALCDEDWHDIGMLAGDVLTLDFDYDLGEGDIDAEIYDSAGTLLDTFDFSFTAPESWDFTAPADDTYAVRMYLDTDAGLTPGNPSYDLTMTVATPASCPVDGNEDDDDATTATAVTLPYSATGLGICDTDVDGGADWYTFQAGEGDVITADIFFSDADGDVDLYLFDSPVLFADRDSSFLSRGFSSSDDESLSYTVPTDGLGTRDFWVLVRLFADGGSVTAGGNVYDIDISIAP